MRPGSNIKTKTFGVHAGNCYNWCLRRASVLGGCSKDVARQLQSFCHQMCCASMEQHTICRWTSGVDVLDLPKPSVCRQPSTEVPGRTKTSKQCHRDRTAICLKRNLDRVRGCQVTTFSNICSPNWLTHVIQLWPTLHTILDFMYILTQYLLTYPQHHHKTGQNSPYPLWHNPLTLFGHSHHLVLSISGFFQSNILVSK